MKPRIINGKRYNTETANLIGKKNGLSLYRKTTGEFFATENDEYIILRDDLEKVKGIAKEILTEKEYIYEFEIRDSDPIGTSLTFPEPIYNKIVALAKENNKNVKETITEILFEHLY